jgi:hypothetical protein
VDGATAIPDEVAEATGRDDPRADARRLPDVESVGVAVVGQRPPHGALAAVRRAGALAALDFSGTLSPGAARFAAGDRIADELRRSGLADLGVADPATFWDALVNPTWERGSTTRIGYVRVLTDATVAHLRARDEGRVDPAEVDRAVRRFAARYLAASAIAPAWRPWLRRLASRAGTAVVVATDHYAEATARILEELAVADIVATALPDGPAHGGAATSVAIDRGAVLVANSADVGHHKQTRPFWERVAEAVGPVARVAVVDDFGAAEAGADAYADSEWIAERRTATVALLATVVARDVTAIPFAPPDGDPGPAIDRAGAALLAALAGGSGAAAD